MPSTIPLCCLHDAFQAVMGWTDSHLHQFEKDGKYWGDPTNREFEDDIEIIDEGRVPISRVLRVEGDSLLYVYDFGDDWRHQVVLEEILPSEGATKPLCLAGDVVGSSKRCWRTVRLRGVLGGHLPARGRRNSPTSVVGRVGSSC